MPRINPHRPFVPNSSQMDLVPEVSGNEINGLGEPEVRKPSVVYWAMVTIFAKACETNNPIYRERQKYGR